MGFALYSVISTNAIVHIVGVFATGQPYNPGLLTALLLFLPFTAWVGYACFGKGRLSYKAMALLVVWGVVLHVLLVGPLFMFINGLINTTTLVASQIVNAGLLLLVTWLGERWLGGSPQRFHRFLQ